MIKTLPCLSNQVKIKINKASIYSVIKISLETLEIVFILKYNSLFFFFFERHNILGCITL